MVLACATSTTASDHTTCDCTHRSGSPPCFHRTASPFSKSIMTPANVASMMNVAETTLELLFDARALLEPSARHNVFNKEDTHPSVKLTCAGHCAEKVGPGIYRSTRSDRALPLHKGLPIYFEFEYLEQPGEGVGACVGISTRRLGLDQLVGSDDVSLGYYSTGNAIRAGDFIDWAEEWKQGDCVGVLIRPLDVGPQGGMTLEMTVNVNGGQFSTPMSLTVPKDSPVYATATLHAIRSKILSRFAIRDLVNTRSIPANALGICGSPILSFKDIPLNVSASAINWL